MTKERRDWRELCAAIAKDEDHMRLLELMEELLAVIDERRNSSSMKTHEIYSLDWSAKTEHPFLFGEFRYLRHPTCRMIAGERCAGCHIVALVVVAVFLLACSASSLFSLHHSSHETP
jgi:hypothetical protein